MAIGAQQPAPQAERGPALKPKLLLLSALYPSPENPVRGSFVQAQAEELAKDYDIRVIAWDYPGACSHRRWREGAREVDYLRFPQVPGFFPSTLPVFVLYALPRIRRICRRWRPDLIQVHDFAHLPALYALKRWLDRDPTPKFLTLHNLKTLPGLMNKSASNFIYQRSLARALGGWNRVFTVNQNLAEAVRPYDPTVACVGNGITEIRREDSPALQEIRNWLGSDCVKILAVGNLIASKGLDLLIQATQRLTEQGLAARTVIVGGGPMQNELQRQIRSLGLSGQILLQPPLPPAVVRNLYFDFDIFALPSWSETFGIVYLEAMYAGLPVIGVRGQGIWGLFAEGEEALFAQPGDLDSLVAHLLWLAKNPQERRRLASNAARRLRSEYMLEAVLAKFKAAYAEALK